mmetsp:Transcript_55204/g.118688  ORF Transcript_55204/g.118688 Transcript_55204/m.118688 type:complete len:221 (-) Transcript_55204:86-748(-)
MAPEDIDVPQAHRHNQRDLRLSPLRRMLYGLGRDDDVVPPLGQEIRNADRLGRVLWRSANLSECLPQDGFVPFPRMGLPPNGMVHHNVPVDHLAIFYDDVEQLQEHAVHRVPVPRREDGVWNEGVGEDGGPDICVGCSGDGDPLALQALRQIWALPQRISTTHLQGEIPRRGVPALAPVFREVALHRRLCHAGLACRRRLGERDSASLRRGSSRDRSGGG